MKCSRRSIRSFASALALVVLATPAPARAADVVTLPTDAIASAVESAIRSRLGNTVRVTVTDIVGVRIVGRPGVLIALPDPSARIGRPTHYLLVDASRERRPRVGEATATARVVANVVRTSSEVRRGARLEGQAIVTQAVDLSGRPFRALPTFDQALGARVKRDIPSGVVVTSSDITPEPIVRAGQTVRVHARFDDVDVATDAVAVEQGAYDSVIRVLNESSRHVLHARVIGKGEVEVVDVR